MALLEGCSVEEPEFERQILAFVEKEGLTALADLGVWAADFQRWRSELKKIPAGDLCISSVLVEYQLRIEKKFTLVIRATWEHGRAFRDGVPICPLAVFSMACMRYPDEGKDIKTE